MKKRILALLLAGLITASLASCVTSERRPDDTSDGSGSQTEESQSREEESTEPPVTVTFIEDPATVYVITDSLTLTPVEADGQSIKASLMDELQRVKVSSDDKRSIIEKDGVQYYASNTYLSTQDLLGKNFESLNNVKMYATQGVNIRPYASANDDFSKAIGGLHKGDEVTVTARGTVGKSTWCKIKYTDSETDKTYEGFVSATYLSEDPDKDYHDYFTACEEVKMYVSSDHLNLRSTPYAEEDSANIVRSLDKDDEVTVIAKGKDDFASWYYVRVANVKEAGMPQTYSEYYANATYLSETKSGLNMTLDELVELYSFTKETKTMYVASDSLNVRTSPDASSDANLVQPGYVKAAEVKVVASGLVNQKQWSIIERTEGEKTVYRFVRSSYLTTDPTGEAVISLDALLTEYPEFKEETETKVYAIEATYGFASLATAPAVANKTIDIPVATQMTMVASGTKFGAAWYIVKDSNDILYFVSAEHFSNAAG